MEAVETEKAEKADSRRPPWRVREVEGMVTKDEDDDDEEEDAVLCFRRRLSSPTSGMHVVEVRSGEGEAEAASATPSWPAPPPPPSLGKCTSPLRSGGLPTPATLCLRPSSLMGVGSNPGTRVFSWISPIAPPCTHSLATSRRLLDAADGAGGLESATGGKGEGGAMGNEGGVGLLGTSVKEKAEEKEKRNEGRPSRLPNGTGGGGCPLRGCAEEKEEEREGGRATVGSPPSPPGGSPAAG